MGLKYNYFQKADVGKVRKAQEDSHGWGDTPNGAVFVVCDGMGGHVGGKQASSIAVGCILEYFQAQQYSDIYQALDGALQYANMQIIGHAATHPELKGMGTTACVVVIKNDNAYIAHVGDSRIYLFLGKEHQLHRITKDHSFVQTLVDAGEITDDEAETHPNKNRILKALGVKEKLVATICSDPVIVKPGDTFLICSDGLSGMVHDTVIEQILKSDADIDIKGTQLIHTALDNGGVDNVTVTLVQITDSPHTQSVFTSFNPSNRQQNISLDTPKEQPSRSKGWIAILAAAIATTLLLLLGGGGIAYYWWQSGSEMHKLNAELKMVDDSLKLVDDEYKQIFNDLRTNESKLVQIEENLSKLKEKTTDYYKNATSKKEYYKAKNDSLSKLKEDHANRKKELESKRDSINEEINKLNKDESSDNR